MNMSFDWRIITILALYLIAGFSLTNFAHGSVLENPLVTRLAQLPHQLNLSVAGNDDTDDFLMLGSYIKAADHPNNILPNCKSFLIEFSKQAGEFIRCSVVNARPFRFCERCADNYMKVTRVYDDIKQNDKTLDDCISVLLNSDRVQIISTIRNSIKDIWDRADCKECFATLSEDSNGTVTKDLTVHAKQFLVLYSNYTSCIPENVTMGRKGYVYNSTVCTDCNHYYRAMNSLFKTMRVNEDSPHPICMDIVDMMNYTRLMWGNTLGCTVRHKDYIPVMIITCIMLLIPVGFYVGLAVYGTKKQRKVIGEKRLSRLSILHSNNYGSIGNSPRPSRRYDITASTSTTQPIINSTPDRSYIQQRPNAGNINSNQLHT